MRRSRANRLRFGNMSGIAAFLAVVAMLAFGPTTLGAQEEERPGNAPEDLPPPLEDHLGESEDGPESEPAPVSDPADPDAEFTNPDGVARHVVREFTMPAIDGPSEKLSDVLPDLDRQGVVSVADQLNTVPAALDAFLEDGLRIDENGVLLYEDPAPVPNSAPVVSEPGPFPNSQTFSLNSRPGSSRVIYLDFTGHTLSGTAWSGGATINVAPWYGTSVSQAEHNLIQDVWARVAEDYAPYDVNVTTQSQTFGAINRTNAADTTYGTRVVVTPDAWDDYNNLCSSACGGVAYVGTYDEWNYFGQDHDHWQPAWVFGETSFQDAKNIAEVASHEAGHNLGLRHDGQGGTIYYAGHNLWAPIMGSAYTRPVAQWSLGEYAGANQTQDDLAVIQSNGLNFRPDDHTDSLITSADNLTVSTTTSTTGNQRTGVISNRNDQDAFEYVGDCAGGSVVGFYVNNNTVSPNLDVQLRMYRNEGAIQLLSTTDPTAAYVNRDVASGMDAAVARIVQDGERVYAYVDGIGVGTASTGYTDYASLGNYTIYADELNPGNDNFPGTTLSGSDTATLMATGTNCGATQTTTEPGAVGGTVWYNWTAPTTGKVFVSTCDDATNFDTYVQVYTGATEGTLTNIANNNDGLAAWCDDTDHSRIVSMNVTAGTNYKVRVRGWSGDKGDFKLTIKYHWCSVGSLRWTPSIIGTPLAETINGTAAPTPSLPTAVTMLSTATVATTAFVAATATTPSTVATGSTTSRATLVTTSSTEELAMTGFVAALATITSTAGLATTSSGATMALTTCWATPELTGCGVATATMTCRAKAATISFTETRTVTP